MKNKDTKWMEDEANIFAACLLIPQKFILEDLRNGLDLTDDKQMETLCKKYGVTMTTMTLRLSLLKLKYANSNKPSRRTKSNPGVERGLDSV